MLASQLSAEEAAVQARTALEEGNRKAAAQFIGRALVADPHRKDWLSILSDLMDSVTDPTALVPLRPGGVSVGEVAVRAYAMFKRKRYHDAIDLLLQAASAAPHSPLLDWGLAWLKRPETATSLNCVKLAARVKALLDDLTRIRTTTDGGAPLLVRLPPLIRRIRQTQVCDSAFLFLAARLLRKIPDQKEAYECAREAHELDPGHASCIALAEVYRDGDDADRAARWYESALEYKPDDTTVRVELGDMLWAAGRPEEAAHWYRAALQIEPYNDLATPSVYAVRYERTQDENWRERLEDYARTNPQNQRAREMADRIGPYFGTWLPEPREESLGLVRLLVQKWEEGKDAPVRGMSLTWLEAPSVYLAFHLQMGRQRKRSKLKIDVDSIPRPDVRKPRVPVNYLLWRYRGTEPAPAVSEPPERTKEAVGQIAQMPYRLKTWLREAAEIAPQFGSSRAREVLSVMVHPPPVPKAFTPWAWVQRVQIVAALIVAKSELAWNGSTRRQALFDVANGPLDWTTSAVILALTMLAEDEPNTADDIARLFNELIREVPKGGHICHVHTLVCCYMHLPNLTNQEHHDLAQWRREIERG